MKYQVKVIQTINKNIFVEAESESAALEKAQTMAEEGEIYFDDEPYLDMDVVIEVMG